MTKQQTLDTPTARNATAEQTGGKDACVIDDEEVAWNQVLGQIRERGVFDTTGAMHDEQARSAALLRRILRDQGVWQLEIEFVNVHTTCTLATSSFGPRLSNFMAGALQFSRRVLDVVIIGGGPAGLSAALVLGRCRRRVLLCDAAQPRNARSIALHGYLTRDGTPPLELLRMGRAELEVYGIEPCHATVTGLACVGEGFEATLDSGKQIQARTALIASGVRDHVPDIPGIDECYGVTVHHCPYCDGWEERDKTIAVIGRGTSGAGLALSLKTWTSTVLLCTNGPSRIQAADRWKLANEGITVHSASIARVEHEQQEVRAIAFTNGAKVPCDAIFFSAGQSPQCGLAVQLGCEINRQGIVKTGRLGQTHVPGLYVVGDASRDVQFAIVAAAEGAKAAVAINKALQERAGLAVAAQDING